MKEIVLGTIGSGFIVCNILEGVSRTNGIRLGAVYSRSGEKGRAIADKYGSAQVYTCLEDMLQDPQINTVYVASPNNMHYMHCRNALEHGKHVICEKPFCPGASEVRDLMDIARSRDLFLADATPTAFLPNFEILKRKIKHVGRIRLVLCSYSQYSGRYDLLKAGELPNVFNPKYAGGCLMDINYYNVYFMVSLFGKPLSAVYYPNLCDTGVDTSGIIILQYPDFVCQGSGAKDTWGVNSAQIQGEEGYLYIENGTNGIESVRLITKHGEEIWNEQTYDMSGESNRWFYEIRNLTSMMLSDDKQRCYEQTQIASDVMEVIENARRTAGIIFQNDEK